MRLTTALLCDHATVREGLLHILGGGINTLSRFEMPATFDVDLAVVIEMTVEELQREHTFTIRGIRVEDDRSESEVLVLNAELGKTLENVTDVTDFVGSKTPVFNVPLVVPTKHLVMGQDGLHRFDLELNGSLDTSLWFRVFVSPELFQEIPINETSSEDEPA